MLPFKYKVLAHFNKLLKFKPVFESESIMTDNDAAEKSTLPEHTRTKGLYN